MSESRTMVVTIIGTGVALGALLIGLVMNQNLRIDDLRGDLTGQIDDEPGSRKPVDAGKWSTHRHSG